MLFTTNDIVQYALDRATRARDVTLDPWLIARTVNDLGRLYVRLILKDDPERLAEEIIVSNADVIADPSDIDLTSSATVEWLHILSMDWRSAAGADYEDEVVLSTIEARHRAETEFGHLGSPVGYLVDRMRTLRKVSGWDGVYDVRVYGVLVPELVDPQDADSFTRVVDYPEPMFRALQTGFLMRVAMHLKPGELELQLWNSEHNAAMMILSEDAENFVDPGFRQEDVPHLGFEV